VYQGQGTPETRGETTEDAVEPRHFETGWQLEAGPAGDSQRTAGAEQCSPQRVWGTTQRAQEAAAGESAEGERTEDGRTLPRGEQQAGGETAAEGGREQEGLTGHAKSAE